MRETPNSCLQHSKGMISLTEKKKDVIRQMTEIILLIMGCSLALLFFIWLVFGKKITSKTATLLMDIGLVALCAATIVCGLLLRQEKYQDAGAGIVTPMNQQTEIQTHTDTDPTVVTQRER